MKPISKVKGKWKYLYRAVDSNGDTIDFMLSAKRNRKAAKRFFKKALSSNHNQIPRVITVDKNPAYPPAIVELKNDKILPKNIGIKQIKYLNNIIEQDHRSILIMKVFSDFAREPYFLQRNPIYGLFDNCTCKVRIECIIFISMSF